MKKIKKETIIKVSIGIILLALISYIWFSFTVMIMPDSTVYYGYLKIFYGEESFSNWNIVRGPSFPIILYIITLLFGRNISRIVNRYIY